jgi:hypothetical protein
MLPFTLRPDQDICEAHAYNFLLNANRGDKVMYAAPTGWGKSYVHLSLLHKLDNALCITPRIEIIDGMLDKMGVGYDDRLWTPIKLRNQIIAGTAPQCDYLLIDEGHHILAESWDQCYVALGRPPAICLTATPYRGNAKETAKLRELWGEPNVIMTYPEAVQRGIINMPECHTIPLIDDDILEVLNGEFVIKQITRETLGRIDDLCHEICRIWNYDKPTMLTVSGGEMADVLVDKLTLMGRRAVAVTDATSRTNRKMAFEMCKQNMALLVQINVVSEGVDLPIRRIFDAAPMFSPVRWLQMFGRCTRPSNDIAEYYCFNRNLMRHCYLLDGCLPISVVKETQTIFPPTERRAVRAFGLESLGKIKPIPIRAKDGWNFDLYCVQQGREQYAAIIIPTQSDVIWAKKINPIGTYGKWVECDPPTQLQGFASMKQYPPTEPMMRWWNQQAEWYGLDKDQKLTSKTFQILPILSNLGKRIK